jgi:outer membrane protein assembly factor BamB
VVVWKYSLGNVSRITHPVVAANGLVYFGANNYLYALRASSGTLAWRYTATTTVGTSVFADVQRIYFGTIDGNLTALNTSTGAFAWHYQGTQGTPTVPTGALSLIYFGTGTTLFALNSQNGALSWSFHAPASLTASAPRAINQLVYIGTAAGALYALNQTTGGIVWIRQLGSSMTVVGPPHAIPDGSNLLIVGLNNQTVAALNWTTGSTVWIVPTTGTIATRLTIAGSGVYGSAFPSPLYKFNKANGATLWTANPGGPLNTSPVVH